MNWILILGYITVLAILPCDCVQYRASFTCLQQPYDIGEVYFLTTGKVNGKEMRNLQTVPYNMADGVIRSNDPSNLQVKTYQVWFFFDCKCMNRLYYDGSTNTVNDFNAGQVELSEKCPDNTT